MREIHSKSYCTLKTEHGPRCSSRSPHRFDNNGYCERYKKGDRRICYYCSIITIDPKKYCTGCKHLTMRPTFCLHPDHLTPNGNGYVVRYTNDQSHMPVRRETCLDLNLFEEH